MINPNVLEANTRKSPRNSFDMGFDSGFTKPLGLLTPCYYQDVIPGDHLKLNVRNFTRTLTLNSAAFTRLHENVDFYFVPYSALWRWWPNLITSMKEQHSAYCPDGQTLQSKLPYITGQQIATVLKNSTTFDIFGYQARTILLRVLDMAGFPTLPTLAATIALYDTSASATCPLGAKQFNIMRLLAFIHIYNDYYRNSDWETLDPHFYNIDNLASGAKIDDSILTGIMSYCGWAYVNLNKDRFTSLKPTPSYGYGFAMSPVIPSNGSFYNFVSDGNGTVARTGSIPAGAQLDLSAQSIRTVLALEKLNLLTNYSAKTFSKQLKAHFGVSPSSTRLYECSFLGSFTSNIGIGEVTATAAGESGSSASILGQVAGKGVGSGQGQIQGDFNDHGIVIGIHYIKADLCYNSDGLDMFNTMLSKNDFYTPEFDALGVEPCLAIEQTGAGQLTATTANNVMGYRTRYSSYKSRESRMHGQLQSTGNLKIWSAPFILRPVSYAGLFSQNKYKASPNDIDTICAVSYGGDDTSDQFLCHYRFDAIMSRNMSVFGIPNL